MKRVVWKWIECLLAVLLLAAVVCGVTVLRAAGEVQAVWQKAQQEADGIVLPTDAAFAAPEVAVLGKTLQPLSAERIRSLDDKLPENAVYDYVQAKLPQYASCTMRAQQKLTTEPIETTDLQWTLTVPEGYAAYLTVTDESGVVIHDGAAEGEYIRSFEANGTDTCTLELRRESDAESVVFTYAFAVTLEVQPTVKLSAATAAQGDVVAVLVEDNIFGEPMALSTELGLCDFVPLETPGSYGAFVPVAYNRGVGDWLIDVTVGDEAYSLSVAVTKRDFTVQYMTISQTIADNTWNSAAASTEFRSTIYPFFEVTDNEKRWDGTFIQPVTGYRLTTEYGLWRYTNGVYSERHSGIDMACPLGTPVVAPQNGEVLYAGYLQLTGNTIVIAHGGGVKSIYYHMDSLDVAAGDAVVTGQKIGEVGTTGYSTGPHLHFEVKIGSQSVDPFQLFDGTSGLFAGQNIG